MQFVDKHSKLTTELTLVSHEQSGWGFVKPVVVLRTVVFLVAVLAVAVLGFLVVAGDFVSSFVTSSIGDAVEVEPSELLIASQLSSVPLLHSSVVVSSIAVAFWLHIKKVDR